jgi:hypothetical protein
MKTSNNSSHSVFASKKGSVLITAVIFSTISIITIASFLKLANHELRLSNNQFYYNQSLNLAEAGLDEAMHLLAFENYDGWQLFGGDARFSVRDLAIGRGATGEFDVLITDWEGASPVVIAEGRVTPGSGLTTTKQLRATLRPRGYLANGITAQCKITFSGGVNFVQSYKSSTGHVGTAQYVKRDRAAVATTLFEDRSLDLGNGRIWGFAFTGGGPVRVGPHGTVQGEDSPPLPLIDPKRVARDFKAIFPQPQPEPPPVSAPPVDLAALEAWIEANEPGKELGALRTVDHYLGPANRESNTHRTNYGTINGTTIIGRPHVKDRLVVYANNINMTGGTLHIVGPVTLVVTGNISMGGGAKLQVGYDVHNKEGANLLIYAFGNVSFGGGGGMDNRTRFPNNLAIFGMAPKVNLCNHSQSFSLGGNASWEAVVYAPNADITLNGGGSSGFMAGAVVGMSVDINGGSNFHYDEDTEAFLRGFGFAMESWEEVPQISRISFN